jgi:protein-disulfide isomerase
VTLAREAGVPDLAEFERCFGSDETLARIDVGRATGRRIGVVGTPTVLVDGWVMTRPPTLEELRARVQASLQVGTGERL